ncbi:hypothetical protein [Paenibacillus brevis]|uniref:Uncharacterized protein n=1 Tax=Paenibacillus brevis TaxID=2841508 RepID=A0ABS6FSZ3_9BACL|nr:hypothetical protein [Paenibacillus brevis]MBU5673229.1 hypothetical protein [Paenibacillus brevis]
MNSFERDPLINCIENGIKNDIRICQQSGALRGALVLILTGIDYMAGLNMPNGQEKATRRDYIEWCDRYIRFNGDHLITGTEFYAARCGMVHSYTSESDFLARNGCRQIGYMDKNETDVVYKPQINENLVMLSIDGFIRAFFSGIDNFFISVFSDGEKARIVEERLEKLVHIFPFQGTEGELEAD